MPLKQQAHDLSERLAQSDDQSDDQDFVGAVSWLWEEED
jgi:hypothetical protein